MTFLPPVLTDSAEGDQLLLKEEKPLELQHRCDSQVKLARGKVPEASPGERS